MSAGHLIARNGSDPADEGPADPERAHLNHSGDVAPCGAAVLLIARLRPAYWPWSWGRLAFSRWFPDQAPGLQFIKTLGSGRGGGFGLAPSASYQGVFCFFDDIEHAEQFEAHSELLDRYRQRSDE